VPELPEVEITRRRIAGVLVQRRIERVRTTAPSYFFLTPPRKLAEKLVGRSVIALERRGKHLLARLDDGAALYLHLGMTGQLFASTAKSPRLLSASARVALDAAQQGGFEPDAHTHLALEFAAPGPAVFFRDVRKFGKVEWLAPGATSERLEGLGPDALEVTGAELRERAAHRRAPLKAVLLDQSVLAGVGNIYADEALFELGYRPTRPPARVPRKDWDRVADVVRRLLLRAIDAGGSSIDDFVHPDGADGAFQTLCRVYGREGQPCVSCGTSIRRAVIGQRSTHYCPRCQR
jgi:formamidopyrimidine-DNA glycosylase